MMGSPPNEAGRADDERPRREVTMLWPLAVGKYEVTVKEYRHFITATGRSSGNGCFVPNFSDANERYKKERLVNWESPDIEQTDRHPVVCVNWRDARAYAIWLSRKTGKQYRLLSEAEWEYAARAGASTRYSWGDEIGRNRANCIDCGSRWNGNGTAPVGSFSANKFGLHDMHGNVWEWVADCRNASYENAPANESVWMEDDCSSRIFRGGSWRSFSSELRSANRGGQAYVSMPGSRRIKPFKRRLYIIGFRVARELTP